MTKRELLLKALRREPVERVPWVPFVGCHAGYLLGITAEEYLRSSDRIVEGIEKAIVLYTPDGIPVLFDLQVEAEAFGCELRWSESNPPAVVTHPLASGVKLEDLTLPAKDDGRLPLILDATARLRERHPDIALYGLVTGPFTLALHLLGTEIFLMMFTDPEQLNAIMQFTSEVCRTMAGYYLDEGCDVIAVVDPMTSQIDENQFEEFVTPFAKPVFEYIREREAMSSFFVCGDATQNLGAMARCRPDNLSVDENISLARIRGIAEEYGISFGGNLKLTSVLLLGDEITTQKHALETLDAGGRQGFILAPGCDLPMETPVKNLQAVSRLVADPYEQQVVRTLEDHIEEEEEIDLSDHWLPGGAVVDVITLDSASCAPCQYMVAAVEEAARDFGGKVKWNEYKIKNKAGLQMMKALGVKNLPSICINGTVAFSSRIPPRNELTEKIRKSIG